MTSSDFGQRIRTVAVLGAGTMGHGIAQICAAAGYTTRLYDVSKELADQGVARVRANLDGAVARGKTSQDARDGALSRLTAHGTIESAADGADLVIEAAPERMELKRALFTQLGALCRADTLLATNTSSLSVTELATGVPHPERVLGMHFFNPPWVLKLLEIVRGVRTGADAVATARAVGARLDREVIVVQDSAGFASSRLGLVLGLEAIRMLESGVASAADIDTAMKHGYRHPMGPLELTDLVGLDVRLAISEYLHRELGGDQYRAPPLLRQMVRAGKLGRKSGEGFYRYDAKGQLVSEARA